MRFCVILGLGTDTVTLMFVPDRERKTRALAHGLGLALSYVERVLPAALRDDVLALGRAWSQNTNAKSNVLAFVRNVLAARSSEARIVRALELPLSQLFPRVSGAKRMGTPQGTDVFPFDAEMVGLDAGLRRLIKRDGLLPTEVAAVSESLVRRGLVVREATEGDGRVVLFAAKNEDVIREAMMLESRIDARGDDAREAAMALGRALGYPDCCVEAFAKLPAHDDLSLALALLPDRREQPAAPYSLWLAPTLALISHTPCALDCAPTVALGKTLCDGVDADRPGFAKAWLTLAQRLVVLTVTGKVLAMVVDGQQIVDVAEAGAEGIMGPVRGLARYFDGWIEGQAGERIGISLRADHRGA